MMSSDSAPAGCVWLLIVSVVAGCVLLASDCAGGSSHTADGVVLGRAHVPAHTTVATQCISSGNSTSCLPVVTYHPALWEVFVSCNGHDAEVENKDAFHRLKDGARVRVSYTAGRWTGEHYDHHFTSDW
jgi:hypothetical protein